MVLGLSGITLTAGCFRRKKPRISRIFAKLAGSIRVIREIRGHSFFRELAAVYLDAGRHK